MPKGRKNGCPVNVKDWLIYIQDKAQVTETWVRINGIISLTRSVSSSTEDGSAETDLWEEPYVTKRNARLQLRGKPVIDAATGDADEGQEMLDSYAEDGGCDADCTLKFIDPYGHALIGDYIVTDTGTDADDTQNERSWDLSQVGEAQSEPYLQVTGVTLKDGSNPITTLSLAVGDSPKIITVAVAPTNASNKRFRVNISGRRFVSVSNITEDTFTLRAEQAGNATVTVTTMNNTKTASIAVTVTQE